MTTTKPEPSTRVAKRETAVDPKIATIRGRLERMQPHFAEVLPAFLTPERMVKLALLSINRQPELLACTAESIAEAVMQVSAWGLELGRTAHLVAFKTQCIAICDYKGKIELAIRGGSITTCRSRVVYEKDAFEVEYGLTERLIHKPTWKEDPGKPVGVYAVVTLPTGETKFELMSAAQVEKIRQRSRAKDNGPWKTDPEEMWKKTAVHRLLKMVPQNPLLASAFEADQEEREATAEAVMAGTYRTQRHVAQGAYGDDEAPRNTLAEEAGEVKTTVVDMSQKPKPRNPAGGGDGYLPEDVGGDAREPDDLTLDQELEREGRV